MPEQNGRDGQEKNLADQALDKIRSAVKGNGIAPDKLEISEYNEQIIKFKATTNLEISADVSEKKVPGKVSGPEVIENQRVAGEVINKKIAEVSKDEETRGRIKSEILERDDKGFGIGGQSLPLSFLDKEYVYYAPCPACGGKGQMQCPRCHGHGYETCTNCKGNGFIPCIHCKGRREIPGPGGAMVKCNHCQGRGQMPCDYCKQTGKIPCTLCKTKKFVPCKDCNGTAWYSNVVNVKVKADCHSDYDSEELPENLNKIINKTGREIIHDVKITPCEPAGKNDQEDVIALCYNVQLPYAEAQINIGENSVRTLLFGKKGRIAEIPDFLDTILKPGMGNLKKAAEGNGNAPDNLKKAAKYRTIKQAIAATARYSQVKAFKILLHHNPLGLSKNAAQSMIQLSDEALNNLTSRQMLIARISGIAGALVIPAVYFLTPVNTILLGEISSGAINKLTGIIVFAAGAGTGYFVYRSLASGAKKAALKKLGFK